MTVVTKRIWILSCVVVAILGAVMVLTDGQEIQTMFGWALILLMVVALYRLGRSFSSKANRIEVVNSAATIRFRGTITKVPGETPGSVFVNAEHRAFALVGVWKSAVPPAENQLVEVELDSDGKVMTIAIVGAPLTEAHPGGLPGADWASLGKSPSEGRSGQVASSHAHAVEATRPQRVRPFLRWAFALIVVLPITGYLGWNHVVQPIVMREFPIISVGRAIKAYQEHDLSTFREYVDVAAFFNDSVDQVAPDGLKGLVKALGQQIFVSMVERLVSEGALPSESNNSEDSSVSQISQWTRELLQSAVRQLRFDELGPSNIAGNTAQMEVRMSLSGHHIPIKARLTWAENHWRVIAIEDLNALGSSLKSAAF